jgi:hypothetical protein
MAQFPTLATAAAASHLPKSHDILINCRVAPVFCRTSSCSPRPRWQGSAERHRRIPTKNRDQPTHRTSYAHALLTNLCKNKSSLWKERDARNTRGIVPRTNSWRWYSIDLLALATIAGTASILMTVLLLPAMCALGRRRGLPSNPGTKREGHAIFQGANLFVSSSILSLPFNSSLLSETHMYYYSYLEGKDASTRPLLDSSALPLNAGQCEQSGRSLHVNQQKYSTPDLFGYT